MRGGDRRLDLVALLNSSSPNVDINAVTSTETSTKWLPPRDLGARTVWAAEHPWLAGGSFGLFMAVFFGAVLAVGGGVEVGLLWGLVMWPATALLFALLEKRRFGQRPDADAHPLPTTRRIWSRASDRYLFWMVTLGVAGGGASIADLVVRSGKSISGWAGVVAAVWLVTSMRSERRLRRRAA